MKKLKIVALTGAGISAESGLQTFRGNDGLWEGYNIHDVATPEAWYKDPELVQRFYNMRRKSVLEATPNAAHKALAFLEQDHDVEIITQNIDNLHERAGSRNVLHLHGEITKSRSTMDPELVYDIAGWELKMGALCEKGHQLRPHIVWFGEPVPLIETAAVKVSEADVLLVIGTSLVVYPAAGLVQYVSPGVPVYVIDPEAPAITPGGTVHFIRQAATLGVPHFITRFLPDLA